MLIVLLKGIFVKSDSASNETNLQPSSNNSLGISLIFLAAQKESCTIYSLSVNGLSRFYKNLDMP